MQQLFAAFQFDGVIHLAAESHVDRSISNPMSFIETNIVGTVVLLNAVLPLEGYDRQTLYHISTDEVYGSLGQAFYGKKPPMIPARPIPPPKPAPTIWCALLPLPAITACSVLSFQLSFSNNQSLPQSLEKLIPLMINNIRHNKPLPVYGDGLYNPRLIL